MMSDDNVPLCVDMDGTLVRSDLSIESALALVRRNPLYLFALPWWLLRGLAYCKREIARRIVPEVAQLPFDPRMLGWLREQFTRTRVLCTASDRRVAEAVAARVGLFDAVLASDGKVNLSGRRKAAALVARFGERGFDYAGNSRADLAVWAKARRAIVVNARPDVLRSARKRTKIDRVFAPATGVWGELLRALRPHQWTKNLLVFVAPLAAHRIDADLARHALIAFVAFCLCASAAYLLNDLLDLDADRAHPRKHLRPFADGRLSLLSGLFGVPVLLLAAFACAMLLPMPFTWALLAYAVTTLVYSLWLKRLPVIDVLVLAGLYTLRIVAGGAAVAVEISIWLVAFAMSLFLGLALLKREIEFSRLASGPLDRLRGRGYRLRDRSVVRAAGIVAGAAAVAVLALYIDSTKSAELYAQPQRLWWLVPLLAAWLVRLWMLAARGRMHDDPLVFALTDWLSLLALATGAGLVLLAL